MSTQKYALVTGGTRGLGKATAIAFAKEGINVAITGRNEDLLKEVVKELSTYNVEAIYACFDITNKEDVKQGIEKITSQFGTFLEMDEKDWQDILMTNVMGMYYVTKEVLPLMVAKNEGDIFNVSSTAGLAGNPTTSAYSASKFAVIGMSESLMKEVRKNNIRVTTLTPSTIASDMSKELGLTDGNPERVLQPEDFAELIVATLKLPRRALIKSAAIWSTNP